MGRKRTIHQLRVSPEAMREDVAGRGEEGIGVDEVVDHADYRAVYKSKRCNTNHVQTSGYQLRCNTFSLHPPSSTSRSCASHSA